MNEQEFAELSAAAALHALSADDERRYRAALAVHPEWRSIAREDADTAAALALTVEPVAPPEGIRSALLAAIADTPQADAGAADPRSASASAEARPAGGADDIRGGSSASRDGRREPEAPAASVPGTGVHRRRSRLLFALAACLVLLVGIGVGAVALRGYLDRPASVVALEQIESAADAEQASASLEGGGSAVAHWSASLGRAVLVADDIPVPADGETYELWFVRGDGPISAGTFSAEDGDAIVELDGEMQPGDAIAVTVEQAGGSPTGQPTSDPVIVIPTA